MVSIVTKIYDDCKTAIADILKDNMTIMAGGFGLCGIPENLIKAIYDSAVSNLTIISNNCGIDDFGLGILLKSKQIKKMISSYVGENKIFESQYLSGELDLELVPQGTLAERIRAGGAGIAGFYTKTGVGTIVAKDKEEKIFNGIPYILETALKADLSIIKAYKSDKFGNLIYRKTARNFNPIIATAADITIAEVEEIVDYIDPDQIHTPSIFVNRLVKSVFEKRIEHITLRKEVDHVE
jgi:3-oxoacid CoA-transferase subunit A